MERPSVEIMREALGISDTKPIQVSPGLQNDVDESDDVYQKWYEDELWRLYQEEFQEKNE